MLSTILSKRDLLRGATMNFRYTLSSRWGKLSDAPNSDAIQEEHQPPPPACQQIHIPIGLRSKQKTRENTNLGHIHTTSTLSPLHFPSLQPQSAIQPPELLIIAYV